MKIRRIISMLLCLSIVLSCVTISGCSKKGKTQGKTLTIWSETSTAKILQNDNGEAVKQADKKDILSVNMAKNEEEGVQLMMYAKKKIDSYRISVSDLSNGEHVISSENVEVWMLKYQEMMGGGTNKRNDEFKTGYAPDPMLPMQTAIEYNENSVKKGENQAIFLDVSTTKDTAAGLYTGMVTVETDVETLSIPMQVNVYDVTLPDCSSLKTYFSVFSRDHFASGELDASDEMSTAYFETMLEYNMSQNFPFEMSGEGEIEEYLRLLKYYYNYPGFSCYRLFYATAAGSYDGTRTDWDVALAQKYLEAIVKMSVEDKVNYLDKAIVYLYTVNDEPKTEEAYNTVFANLEVYYRMLENCDYEMRQVYAGTDDYQYYEQNVSKTLLNIPYLLPGATYVLDAMQQYGEKLDGITPVLQVATYNSERNRRLAAEGREDEYKQLWMYTCLYPIYPFPSAHSDDYCLGWRLCSWMCKDYDWDGYLMWAAADYLATSYGEVQSEDLWESTDTGFESPGDGKYFYPGEKYGLDEPCPSLRAVAYRDGVDDYEVLKVLEGIYEERDLDASQILNTIYDKVYSEVIPITDSDLFESVRVELFELIKDTKSDVGVLYKTIDIGLKEAEMSFVTTNGKAKASVDGKTLEADEDGVYHVKTDLGKAKACTIKITYGEKEKEYTTVFLTGELGTICSFEDGGNADDFVFSTSDGYEAKLESGITFVQDGNTSLHLTINKDKTNTLPYFGISKDSELIGGSFKDVKSIKFYVYDPASDVDVMLNATSTTMDVTYYTDSEVKIDSYNIIPGDWSLIEVNLSKITDNPEMIEEIDFNFAEGTKVELYLDSFVVVRGEE